MNIVILEPSCPERVRANAYYLGRLVYAAMLSLNYNVCFCTDVTVPKVYDKLVNSSIFNSETKIIIHLWSELQVPEALSIHTMIKSYVPEIEIFYIGFNPILEKYGLKKAYSSYEEVILLGLIHQDAYSNSALKLNIYNESLTTIPEIEDCDAHTLVLKEDSGKYFHPLLTSVGCPMGCKFCKVSQYQRKPILMDTRDVSSLLKRIRIQGILNIHFFDDNFLAYPKRAIEILRGMLTIDSDFKVIFLATLKSAYEFIILLKELSKEEREAILNMIHLVEIGLETSDDVISKNIGKDVPKNHLSPKLVVGYFPILWLTITFLPGETIGTLNRTGKFLAEYGLKWEEMVPRMRTAGTREGLGQFFCPYEGTGINESDLMQGDYLIEPPLRLLPSWIPTSFLNSRFRVNWHNFSEKERFSNAVKVEEVINAYGLECPRFLNQLRIDHIYQVENFYMQASGDSCRQNRMQFISYCVSLAIMARMGMILEA